MIHTFGRHTYKGGITNPFNITLTVGKFSSLADGLTIVGSNHPMGTAVSTYPFKELWGADYPPCDATESVTIGNDVWIGQGVTIIQGATIADGAIIGAGAVVAGSIPPYAVAVGNPSRVIRYRFPFPITQKLLEMKWWNWPDERIREAIPDMKNVSTFIDTYMKG